MSNLKNVINLKFITVKIIFLIVVIVLVRIARFNIATNEFNEKTVNQEDKQVLHVNTKPNGEMRAVWVPYMTLDLKGDYSESSFRRKFDEIATSAKNMHLNTLIVQVRPYADALYKSALYPWSHLLTGEQGRDPGYDPLEYMVRKSHELDLKIHAWINPLRIQKNNVPEKLSIENEYFKLKDDQDKVFEVNNEKYFNPAYPQNRARIIDGVKEIVEKYSIDGIQFDDYFYPDSDGDFDKISFDSYRNNAKENPLSLHDWRCANIDSLVCGVYSAIKSVCPIVQFGISPQGNIQNDLKIGADVQKWCSSPGYVDYICPQLYVSLQHPSFPFEKMASQWHDVVKCNNIDLYYGLGVYKAGSDMDQGTWKNSDDILQKQIEYGRSNNMNGFMLYSWDYLFKPETQPEVLNVLKTIT